MAEGVKEPGHGVWVLRRFDHQERAEQLGRPVAYPGQCRISRPAVAGISGEQAPEPVSGFRRLGTAQRQRNLHPDPGIWVHRHVCNETGERR